VVRRLFGFEPFLDFERSDSVARAVLLDSAVQLVWQLRAAGRYDAHGSVEFLLDFVVLLHDETARLRELIAEAEAYCGLTHLQASGAMILNTTRLQNPVPLFSSNRLRVLRPGNMHFRRSADWRTSSYRLWV
jgi:hypothetical protein